MDEHRIAARVEARKLAGLILEMAGQETLPTSDARELFWATIRDEALKWAPLPVPQRTERTKAMTPAQCREFEKVKLPYGKYEGETVGDVAFDDPGYLDWLVGSGDDFKVQLNRYLMEDRSVPELDDETIPY